jgi:FkbM family methyltransferase
MAEHHLSQITKTDGFWFPAYDQRCRLHVFRQEPQFLEALKHVKKLEYVVQAGGNVGVWPRWLCRRFRWVYTFEADPLNFRCLTTNCEEENIIKFNAALGERHECVSIARGDYKGENNCGGNSVKGKGVIPTLRVDDLALPGCDLLQLDIEGYEYFALLGAAETIKKYKPVVQIEDKGHGKRYGVAGKNAEFLNKLGMVEAIKIGPDRIFTWAE